MVKKSNGVVRGLPHYHFLVRKPNRSKENIENPLVSRYKVLTQSLPMMDFRFQVSMLS